MKNLVFVLLIVAALISACASPTPAPAPTSVPAATVGSIQISDIWIRAASMGPASSASMSMGGMSSSSASMSMGGMSSSSASMSGMSMSGANSAAYMVIRNTGNTADKLVKAETNAAKTVETHTTVKEGDVMKMQQVNGIDVPANGQTKLEPGALHVMLIGLTRNLNA